MMSQHLIFSKAVHTINAGITNLCHFGAHLNITEQEKKRIILTNQISLLLFLLCILITALVSVVIGANSNSAKIMYLCLLLELVVPFINKAGFEKAAKCLLLSILCFIPIFVGGTAARSPETMRASGDWQFAALFVPIILFRPQEMKWRLSGVVFVIISYFSIYWIHPRLNASFGPDPAIHAVWYVTSFLALVTVSATFFLSQRLDISILEKSESKYRRLSEELDIRVKERTAQLLQSEKLSAIGQMVAGVAHEVNSPRAAVDHYVTLTERQVDKVLAIQPLQAEVAVPIGKIKREFIPAMSDAITRIGELTNGLLNFTRAEHKEMKSSDMHQIIDSVVVLLRSQLQGRIEIIKQYGDIPPVVCYPGQMNQVFMNILTNAIQAIADTGTITITTAMNQGKVEIRIKDTGIGMDEETKKKIFDPFFTTKEVGKGTGLGMSIVWEILQKHGAEVIVHSVKNEGTEFILHIKQ